MRTKRIWKSRDMRLAFERFFEGRESDSESVGIGLALSNTIIKKEYGEILVSGEVNRGTVFEIIWRQFMNILEVNNLCKVYGSGETKVDALRNVSFSVEKGEFVAIIGPSGSGKSTLLHIIGGVDIPTSGTVKIGETDIAALDETALAIFRRRQIGLIYQFYNLIPILNVEENLTLPLLLDGRKPDKKAVADIIEKLGLQDRTGHLPNQLSGGQQQRVSIGRALINSPALLLADEPTGNLDSENSRDILKLLRKFNKEQNQTVIIITHDEKIAMAADRIIAIEDGIISRDEKNLAVNYERQNTRCGT